MCVYVYIITFLPLHNHLIWLVYQRYVTLGKALTQSETFNFLAT